MNKLIALVAIASIGWNIITVKAPQPFEATTIEQRAASVGLTVEEFELFSSVVEAESNRQDPADGEFTTDGRIYIALTIWNRVRSDRWPETVTGVLTQSGQFSTVRNGHSVTDRTEWSDRAVYEAYIWLNEEASDAPDVQFFNCRYWFSGVERYGDSAIGGNYFSYGC